MTIVHKLTIFTKNSQLDLTNANGNYNINNAIERELVFCVNYLLTFIR